MELWKDIPNYEGFYQASNLGRIRSLYTNKIMEPHRRRELLKIRQSFLERYKLAKQFNDKFYTEYFAKQIRDIDKEMEEYNE